MGRRAFEDSEKSFNKRRTIALVESIDDWIAVINANPERRPATLEQRYEKLRGARFTGAWAATLLLHDPKEHDTTLPPNADQRTFWSAYKAESQRHDHRMRYQTMRKVARRATDLLGWDPGQFWYLLAECYEGHDPESDEPRDDQPTHQQLVAQIEDRVLELVFRRHLCPASIPAFTQDLAQKAAEQAARYEAKWEEAKRALGIEDGSSSTVADWNQGAYEAQLRTMGWSKKEIEWARGIWP